MCRVKLSLWTSFWTFFWAIFMTMSVGSSTFAKDGEKPLVFLNEEQLIATFKKGKVETDSSVSRETLIINRDLLVSNGLKFDPIRGRVLNADGKAIKAFLIYKNRTSWILHDSEKKEAESSKATTASKENAPVKSASVSTVTESVASPVAQAAAPAPAQSTAAEPVQAPAPQVQMAAQPAPQVPQQQALTNEQIAAFNLQMRQLYAENLALKRANLNLLNELNDLRGKLQGASKSDAAETPAR